MSSTDDEGPSDGAPLQRAAWIDGGATAEEARIGDARLVRGGAKVSTFTEDGPGADAELPRRGRILSEAEIAEGGLLRERVIEIGEMREEAVVSKHAVVREELVVRKDVERRTEQVSETLRRTEVDVERIEAGPEGAEDREHVEDARAR